MSPFNCVNKLWLFLSTTFVYQYLLVINQHQHMLPAGYNLLYSFYRENIWIDFFPPYTSSWNEGIERLILCATADDDVVLSFSFS